MKTPQSNLPDAALRITALLLFLALPLATHAATRVWDGSSSGLWSVNANWSGGASPQNGDKVEFPAGVPRKIITNDLVGLVLQGVTFPDAGSDGYVIRGNEIIFQADSTDADSMAIIRADNNSGVVRIECPLNFGVNLILGGGLFFVFHTNGEMEVSSPITLGAGNDVSVRCLGPRFEFAGPISGTGDLFLISTLIEMTGTSANTFNGLTVCDGIGTLRLSRGSQVGPIFIPAVSIPGDLRVDPGSGVLTNIVELLRPGQIANSSKVTLSGISRLDLAGNDDGIGSLVLNGGDVVGGGGTLTVNGDVSGVRGRILADVNLGSGILTVTNSGISPGIVINGIISGTGGITKAGAGTLRFEGSSANTYTGVTTVRGGVLELAKSSGVSIVGSQLIIGDSSDGEATDIVRYESNFDMSTVSDITINRTGLLDFGAFTDDIGDLNLAGGTVQSTTGLIELRGNVTATASSVGFTAVSARILGDLDLGSANRTFTVNDDFFLGGTPLDLDVSANISGTGGIIKSGDGEMRLNSPNTFSGAVTVNNGMLIANDDAALGTSAGGVTVSSTGTLELFNVVVAGEALTLNSTASEPGALFADGTTNFWGGPIVVSGTSRIGVDVSCSLNLGGAISGAGGIEKQDDGQLLFRGAVANTYSGTTFIKAGSLFADKTVSDGSIPGDLIIGDGLGGVDADLVFYSSSQINNNSDVTIASSGMLQLGADTIGSLSGTGRVDILTTGELRTGNNNASTTFDGLVTGGGGLTKRGTGTFTLSGNNTYSGPTLVDAGKLVVNGQQSGSDVTVNAGTLGGKGRVSDLIAHTGSTVAPGASPGQLRSANTIITNNSLFVVEINGPVAGTDYDQLSVSGTVNLTGSQLIVTMSYVPVEGDVFRIIENNGTDAVTGTFAGLANNATLTANGITLRINYNGGSGNDVTLSVTSLPLTPSPDFLPVVGTGNGNGRLDPNECNTLTLSVKNGGGVTLSNIIGTLSTTTPEVVITEPSSAYPNVAAGATRSNSVPFQFFTTPGFLCGQAIEFLLTITASNQPAFALPYVIQSGALAAAKSFTNSTATGLPGSGVVNIPLVVSGITGNLANVTVAVDLTYPNLSELLILLIPPGGPAIPLAASLGGSQLGTNCSNGRTIFNDSASLSISDGASPYVGNFRPLAPLAVFDGRPDSLINGSWILQIQDLVPNAVPGVISCWSLSITPSTCTNGAGPCEICNGPFFGSITTNDNAAQVPALGATTCASPCPGIVLAGSGHSDMYTFTNGSRADVCVTATVEVSCATPLNSFSSTAFLNNPIPPGFCGLAGSSGVITNDQPVIWSFRVPSNGVFSVWVSGLGGSTCDSYTLRVDGFDCPIDLRAGGAGAGRIRIDWPSYGSRYFLESSTNLSAPNWVTVTNAPVVNNGDFVITNNAVIPRQFYRLFKP